MIRFLFRLWGTLFWRFRWMDSAAPDTVRDPLWVTGKCGLAEVWGLVRGQPAQWRILIHGEEEPGWRAWVAARGLGAILVSKTRELAERTADAHRRGLPVLLVHDGLPIETLVEVARLARATVLPVEVLRTDCIRLGRPHALLEEWVSCGSFHIHQAPPIEPAGLGIDLLAQTVMELQARALEAHPALEGHLARLIVRNLRGRFFQPVFTDAFQNGRSLRGGMLLGVAWELAEWIKRNISGPRVGIVLPPGLGATIANLACLLADKTPVNLNFTMGRAANAKAIAAAGLTQTITADAFVAKVGDFPWTPERFDLAKLLKNLGKFSILARAFRALVYPTDRILHELGIPAKGGNREAGLLFTSGSSGDPKGVPLSHRNIIANILQVEAILPAAKIKSLLGCLPIFHSFGFTVTLWWPLAGGPRVVTYVSPLDSAKIASIIGEYDISLLITTPTFLRALLRKAKPEQFASLALVVTGAEKLPTPLLEEFESKTGVPVCEGYGMTEACPVISTNLTDEVVEAAGGRLPGRTVGSVGRPLYGIAVRVCHPETGEYLPISHTGLLWFRGANVFRGYLDDPAKSELVLRDGWYSSGDVGHVDAKGFLFIDGRMSRFSKIGGEMVPHGTVEMHLFDILRESQGSGAEIGLAVVGTRDPQKGEALVVLVNGEVDPEVIRKGMAARGLPNLWIPKQFVRVEAVPTLASGKLDLRKCQELAEAAGKG
jgi:acyl-[acyl-carrier-protein]-phospholipid O-acyltransferase / long-chain-fatty-acid--[acyl-carrier-protein] ligase